MLHHFKSLNQLKDAEPRLPIDRLNTLNQFVHDWITENIEKRAKRPQRAYHMVS